MKYLVAIFLLLLSNILYAQSGNKSKPVKGDPNIHITRGISTTVTNQPASIPNSNTNPTTGTVISMKAVKKNPTTVTPGGKDEPGAVPVNYKADTTVKYNRSRPAHQKRATKKTKVAMKKAN